MKWLSFLFSFIATFYIVGCQDPSSNEAPPKRLNILFAIADDQSFPYASAYGDLTALTPNFDAVAKRGVLFNNAFVAAPQCSPSRAAILTGRNIWQLEEAGTHSSYFPKKYGVFTDALEQNGYALGFTGKPWGPGNWKDAGWDRNPAGPEYNEIKLDTIPYSGIRKLDYAANFKAFLEQKDDGQPFFFWYGASEPHRVFEAGSGLKEGKNPEDVQLPDFLPDAEVIRNDILDYSVEIEWFDKHLGEMIALLDAAGELDNTLIVITADNGMAFPSAKANLQEYGTHVPLAIAGPGITGNRSTNDLISLIDLAPTFLELSGTPALEGITGRSLAQLLLSSQQGGEPFNANSQDLTVFQDQVSTYTSRQMVLTGRERHTHARPDNLGYPSRAIRTADYLYIYNIKPDRWPAGDPEVEFDEGHVPLKGFKAMEEGYHDIDASPSKSFLQNHRETQEKYFRLAVAQRPEVQLYDIRKDPGCTENLADQPGYTEIQKKLRSQLVAALTEQGDPRMLGRGDIFESYPRFGGMREFSGFKERGKYNPAYQQHLED